MPLFETVVGGIAASVLDGAIKMGRYTINEIRDGYSEVEHHQRLIAASNAYADNYANRHCQIKVMPWLMKEPVNLESIYTDVKILDDRSVRAFMGLVELENAYRMRGQRGFGHRDAKRLNGMSVANAEQFLMVLGGPGIGKSTFLRKIGLEALKKDGTLHQEHIPVFLELKKFREKEIDIQQKIVEEFKNCKFPSAEAFVTSALEQGKLLVLFDGLDEVPSKDLNRVIEEIEDFVDRHSQNSAAKGEQNRFVASCRIAAYHSGFERFTNVTISEFDDEQIRQFIRRWFSSEEDKELKTSEKYLDLLNQKDHRATKELAQTPLLLTFLCLVYDREQLLPRSRSTLYGKALNIILHEWSAQKRLDRDPIYEGLNPELEKELLANIAYESFEQDQPFFSEETILEHISAFLGDTLDNPKYLDAKAVLNAIEIQQGILVERAIEAYSFSHLTLQEYLTALYVVESRIEDDLVLNYLTDERWREVFLLTSGLTKNPVPRLLEHIGRQAHSYVKPYPSVQKLLKWSASDKYSDPDLRQRATMLMIAINTANALDSVNDMEIGTDIIFSGDIVCTRDISFEIAKAINSARDTASARDVSMHSSSSRARGRANVSYSSTADATAVAIAEAIDSASYSANTISNETNHYFFNPQSLSALLESLKGQEKILPGVDQSSREWLLWADQLEEIWLGTLKIEIEDITLSGDGARALNNYLYAVELLLRCKQSAVRISRTAWERLEANLLTWHEDTWCEVE